MKNCHGLIILTLFVKVKHILENKHLYMSINTSLLKLRMRDMGKYLQVSIIYSDGITNP